MQGEWTSKYELTLTVTETAAGFVATWEYASDLFDRSTVEQLAEAYTVLLAHVTTAEGAHAPARLPLPLPLPRATRDAANWSETDRAQVLYGWNQTQRAYPRDATLVDLFLVHARLTPQATAVRTADGEISYGALGAQVEALAAQLRDAGGGPGAVVGVCLERGVQLPLALLAVLTTGAAYVPLDPESPRQRLAFLLQDAGVSLVLTDAASAGVLPEGVPRWVLDEAGGPLSTPSPPGWRHLGRPRNGTAEDIAYILYTSGSTGVPKGVAVCVRLVVNLLLSLREQIGFGPQEVLLAVTSVSFDIAALELFLPLVTGATLAVAASATGREGRALAARKPPGG